MSAVTTVRVWARAVAAMSRSWAPLVRPLVRVWASSSAWTRATWSSYGSTGMVGQCESTNARREALWRRSANSTPTSSSAAVIAAITTSSSSATTCSIAAVERSAAMRMVVSRIRRSSVAPVARRRLAAQRDPRPARIHRLRAQQRLHRTTACGRGGRDARDDAPVALDEKRLAIMLDLIEHIREPPRCLGRSQSPHAIRLSDSHVTNLAPRVPQRATSDSAECTRKRPRMPVRQC